MHLTLKKLSIDSNVQQLRERWTTYIGNLNPLKLLCVDTRGADHQDQAC